MTTPAPPFCVPYPRNPQFIGRKRELKLLQDSIAAQPISGAIPAIAGLGGMGKSQLAVELAYRALQEEQFPGGIFWISMAEPEGVTTQVAQLGGPDGLDLPGWAALSFDDQVKAVERAWRQPVPRLLIFDNLEDPVLFQRWRPVGGGSRVLITMRNTQWPSYSGVEVVELEGLDRKQSVRLLLTPRARTQAGLQRLLDDPSTTEAADAICELFGDLPLAITVAGTYLERFRSLSVPDYHQRLLAEAKLHPSLDQELTAQLPTGHAASIVATFRTSYDQLDPAQDVDAAALRLFHRAAYGASDPLPPALLTHLVAPDPDQPADQLEVDLILDRLASLGLLRLFDEGAAQLHPLLAAFARHVAPNAEAVEAMARALHGIFYSFDQVGMYRVRDSPRLLSHARATIKAVERGLDLSTTEAILLKLYVATGQTLYSQGVYTEAGVYFERGLEIIERTVGPDHTSTARIINGLALVLSAQGAYDQARSLFERALLIFQHTLGPDHPDTAGNLNNLAILLRDQGSYIEARRLFEQALEVYTHTLGPDHLDTAAILSNLGLLLRTQGELAEAQKFLERAFGVYERTLGPDHPNTARSLTNLALLFKDLGMNEKARSLFERALEIYGRTLAPDHPSTATNLNSLALLLRTQGELAEAQKLMERALHIRERTFGPEHPDTAGILNNLALLFKDLGMNEKARPLFERALGIFERALGPIHPRTQGVRANLAALPPPPTPLSPS